MAKIANGGMRRAAMMSTVAAAALLATATGALAGGFGIREQSAEFQGSSFAGNAAGGGGLSGMFWNPAVAGQFDGIRTESHYAYIIPQADIHALPGSTLLFNGADSGNIGADALVGSSYLSYQLSNKLVFGFSFNAPYGLSTEPSNRMWAGMTQARTSEIKTYNGQATLAYRVSSNFIVAGGVMVEHIYGRLKQAGGVLASSQNVVVEGDDTSVGWTVGAIWNPTSTTSIGLGYRSDISHNLEGNIFLAGPVGAFGGGKGGTGSASIQAPITMPGIATLSLRQAITPRLDLLATGEWTNWSKLDQLQVQCTSSSTGINLLGCPGAGAVQSTLPLNWHDGWFASLGAEYKYSPALLLRTGVAWEKSPIQNASERTPRAPDSDRVWLSAGATYKWSERISFDLAYSHIFMDDGQIDRTSSGVRLLADVSSQIDIVS
ncbi:MAG: outer membrane protein transport protein, partial [Proteobacteria bacterium]|nr:outer membrane protein transport protein [Pseudomonadota bacterium]